MRKEPNKGPITDYIGHSLAEELKENNIKATVEMAAKDAVTVIKEEPMEEPFPMGFAEQEKELRHEYEILQKDFDRTISNKVVRIPLQCT